MEDGDREIEIVKDTDGERWRYKKKEIVKDTDGERWR